MRISIFSAYRTLLFPAAVIAGILALSGFSSTGKAQERFKLGILSCDVVGTSGFVFRKTEQLLCRLEKGGQEAAAYNGQIRKFGLNVGTAEQTLISWIVFAASPSAAAADVAGNYGGVSAEATFGIGLGANVLLGGSNDSIALQPLSIQTQRGLNVAASITELILTPVPQPIGPGRMQAQ